MIQNYQPLGKRLLIRIEEDKHDFEKTKSGIILTITNTEKKYVNATVILVGELSNHFKEGDRILINKLKTEEIEIEGEKYNIAHCDDISFKVINS